VYYWYYYCCCYLDQDTIHYVIQIVPSHSVFVCVSAYYSSYIFIVFILTIIYCLFSRFRSLFISFHTNPKNIFPIEQVTFISKCKLLLHMIGVDYV